MKNKKRTALVLTDSLVEFAGGLVQQDKIMEDDMENVMHIIETCMPKSLQLAFWFMAVSYGHADLLSAFLEKGIVTVDERNFDHYTDTEDGRDLDGYTALMMASEGIDQRKVFSVLLEAGANIEARNGIGMTPLMLASQPGVNPVAVEELISAGANACAKNNMGKTARMLTSSLDDGRDEFRFGPSHCDEYVSGLLKSSEHANSNVPA